MAYAVKVEIRDPRANITVKHTVLAMRPLGRADLKPFNDWNDGRPETELNFKYYCQATTKIVGILDGVVRFFENLF